MGKRVRVHDGVGHFCYVLSVGVPGLTRTSLNPTYVHMYIYYNGWKKSCTTSGPEQLQVPSLGIYRVVQDFLHQQHCDTLNPTILF